MVFLLCGMLIDAFVVTSRFVDKCWRLWPVLSIFMLICSIHI